MASTARAHQAALFMRRCRQVTNRQSSSDASPYSPSSFNQPLRSPLGTSPTSTKSNIDHLPPPPSRTSTQPTDTSSTPIPTLQSRTSSRSKPPTHAKFTFSNWLRHTLGFQVHAPTIHPAPFHLHNNPYRAKKTWPPDFRTLHPSQQFHFEKTFRRRALLQWARPNWHKWVKRVRASMMIMLVVYFVFIAQPEGGTPFDGFRVWFFGKLKGFGLTEAQREEVERLEEMVKAERDERLRVHREKVAKGASPVAEG